MRVMILCSMAMAIPMMFSAYALGADATPAPSKDTVEANCDAMGGEYFEDGSDFYGCELSSGTTVACLDWYGCIAWQEKPAGSRVRRDHRLKSKFGLVNVMPKPDAFRRNKVIADRAIKVKVELN